MLKFVINYHKLLVFRFKKKEIIFLSIPLLQVSHNFPFRKKLSEWLELTLFFLKECLPININRSEKRLALF